MKNKPCWNSERASGSLEYYNPYWYEKSHKERGLFPFVVSAGIVLLCQYRKYITSETPYQQSYEN
jgi:hypothetical protein